MDNFCVLESASFLQIGSTSKSSVNWQMHKYFTYLQETKIERADSWETMPNKYSIYQKKKEKKKKRTALLHLIQEQDCFFNRNVLNLFKVSGLCLVVFNDHNCTKLVHLPVKVRTAGQTWRLTFIVFSCLDSFYAVYRFCT